MPTLVIVQKVMFVIFIMTGLQEVVTLKSVGFGLADAVRRGARVHLSIPRGDPDEAIPPNYLIDTKREEGLEVHVHLMMNGGGGDHQTTDIDVDHGHQGTEIDAIRGIVVTTGSIEGNVAVADRDHARRTRDGLVHHCMQATRIAIRERNQTVEREKDL